MKLGTRLRRAMRSLTATQPPKAKNIHTTQTHGTYYEGMDPDYRWFRQDELARKTITTNAVFATQGGFQTIQEPPEEPLVKDKIDEINKRLNLDSILFVAQIKRSVYGKAAFEIIRDGEGYPTRLLSLQSTRIKPDIDENWSLTGYTYRGQKAFYRPEDVLYFTNLELESDRQGLSDLEPLRAVLEARHLILRENLPEIARTLWAPYVILKADTSGLPFDEAEKIVQDLANVARAGKSIAINESVEATVVDITPDTQGLNRLLDKLEEAITANFGVPRFLLGRPIENRATAYAELEAYVQGPITHIQRYLKRELEAQWYDRWTRK
ncbi:phage portal protein, partial [Candidatus Bathyarchaeota archaeon]|nr:phage portal protein [Candidatus Bathyarchaeota archaeon]